MIWRLTGLAVMLAFIGHDIAIAQNESLGRLFYTPEQRAALNANIRSISKAPTKSISIPPSVSLNGIVTRSDGERTVWIDGRAYHQGNNPRDVRVITRSADPAGVELKVTGIQRRVKVRVGQRVEPASGNTFETYETLPARAKPAAKQRTPVADSGAEPITK